MEHRSRRKICSHESPQKSETCVYKSKNKLGEHLQVFSLSIPHSSSQIWFTSFLIWAVNIVKSVLKRERPFFGSWFSDQPLQEFSWTQKQIIINRLSDVMKNMNEQTWSFGAFFWLVQLVWMKCCLEAGQFGLQSILGNNNQIVFLGWSICPRKQKFCV